MGHHSVAMTIKEKLENEGHKADVVDIVETINPTLSKVLYSGFNKMVNKAPNLYNKIIEITDKNAKGTVTELPMVGVGRRAVAKLVKEGDYYCVISTIHLASKYVSSYKEKTGDPITLFTVITDISSKGEWIAPKTDRYFVASSRVKMELMQKGISREKIVVSGIPVSAKFSQNKDSQKDKKNILIMGGGLGLIPIGEYGLSKLNENSNVSVTIITGRNRKLYNQLEGKYKNLHIIGYTNRVNEYMNKADVLVSKAGGICTFEAIRSGTPLIAVNPSLAQEVVNGQFVENKAMGKVVLGNHENVYREINKIMNNPSLLMNMKRNMKSFSDLVKEERLIYEVNSFDHHRDTCGIASAYGLLQAKESI